MPTLSSTGIQLTYGVFYGPGATFPATYGKFVQS